MGTLLGRLGALGINPYVAALFWYGLSFPGRMSADSIMVIGEVRQKTWNQHHTIVYEVIVYLFSFGGKFVWLLSLLQLTFLALAISKFFNEFFSDLSNQVRKKIGFFIMLVPYFGGFASTIWKDSISMSITILMVTYFKKSKLIMKNSDFLIGLTLLSILVSIRYENTLTVLLVGLPVVIISAGKRIAVLVFFIVPIIVAFSVTSGLNHLLDATPIPYKLKYVIPLSDLASLVQDYPNDFELVTYVNGFSKGKSLEGSNFCPNVNPFLYTEDYKIVGGDSLTNNPVQVWLKYAIKYPGEMLKTHQCRGAAFLPMPISLHPKYIYFLHPGIDENGLGIKFNPISNRINTAATYLINNVVAPLIWPGFLITIFYALILILRKSINFKDHANLVVILWPIANSIVLGIVTPGQDFRYMSSSCCLMFLFGAGVVRRTLSTKLNE